MVPRLQDFENGSLYGLEKLWAFHHYTGFPKDQPNLQMVPKVGWLWAGVSACGSCLSAALLPCLRCHAVCSMLRCCCCLRALAACMPAPRWTADAMFPC